jgi:hypothetical protein
MFALSSSKVNYVDFKNLSARGNKRKFNDNNPSNNSNNKQNKLVTIVEKMDILSVSAETRRSKRKMIIKFLIKPIWLRRILIL